MSSFSLKSSPLQIEFQRAWITISWLKKILLVVNSKHGKQWTSLSLPYCCSVWNLQQAQTSPISSFVNHDWSANCHDVGSDFMMMVVFRLLVNFTGRITFPKLNFVGADCIMQWNSFYCYIIIITLRTINYSGTVWAVDLGSSPQVCHPFSCPWSPRIVWAVPTA